MGLDIYKFELSKEPTDFYFELKEDETNKSVLALFEKFKEYILETEVEYYDFDSYFKSLNEDYDNYEISSIKCDENDCFFLLKNNKTGKEIGVSGSILSMIKKSIKVLYFKKTGYQREGMNIDFYREIYGSCWYVNGSDTILKEEDYTYFVLDNDTLDKVKTYVYKDKENIKNETLYPIEKWKLNENEVVYFCA